MNTRCLTLYDSAILELLCQCTSDNIMNTIMTVDVPFCTFETVLHTPKHSRSWRICGLPCCKTLIHCDNVSRTVSLARYELHNGLDPTGIRWHSVCLSSHEFKNLHKWRSEMLGHLTLMLNPTSLLYYSQTLTALVREYIAHLSCDARTYSLADVVLTPCVDDDDGRSNRFFTDFLAVSKLLTKE